MQLKKKYKTVLARLKNKLFGRKRNHLIEPYTVWTDRNICGQTVSYRKVYYWYGRKNSPFHRKYRKGIQITGKGILDFESIESYINNVCMTTFMDDNAICANDCAEIAAA
ncbi:hypothetical protein pEaSNUABM8_00088 [Erwinia phage pEa_SNUABM_8]|nr:hypothetical protein pEaSNUABM8_00088 [Erwinia phage pEa_SNUABM_8]QVW54840.1 hypothetical protein pEaSNUABM4_00087 [Erwinia phage pEa_SNUABM_4]